MKSAAVIFCLSLLSLTAPATAQRHAYDFLVDPAGLVVNPFSTLYSYDDGTGWLWTAQNRVSLRSSNQPIGHITSSCFIDPLLGYVTGQYGMLTTTDGGRTWKDLGRPPIDGGLEDVEYHPGTRLLFVTSRGSGLWVSTDKGKRWKKQMNGYYNGISFSGLVGVVTGSQEGFGLRTTDGGQTWMQSDQPAVAGKPCFSVSEQEFIAASEIDHSLYHSSDSGKTWSKELTFEYQLLGDIFEDCGKLYVPSYTGYYFYNDADWSHHQVSPRNPIVYCITPKSFYYVVGNLSKPLLTRLVQQNNLQLTSTDQYILPVTRCKAAVSKRSAIVTTGGPNAEITVSIWNPSGNIKIISEPDTDVRGTFEFTFEASDNGVGDSALIVIHARVGCRETFSYIRVYTISVGERSPLNAANLLFPRTSTCNTVRRWVYITNPDCESITVEQAVLRNNVASLTLLDADKLPKVLAPFAKDSFEVEFAPTKIGTVTDFVDVAYKAGSKRFIVSSIVSATGSGIVAMNVEHDTIDFGIISRCAPVLRSTTIENLGCDSVLIDQVELPSNSIFSLAESLSGKWIRVDEVYGLEIQPDLSRPGIYDDLLTLHATNPNGSKLLIHIVLKATIETPKQDYTLWAPSAIEGLTSCTSHDTIVIVRNTSQCDALILTDASITGDGLTITEEHLPITLHPGDSTSIRVLFDGTDRTSINGSLVISTDLFGELSIPLAARVTTPRRCDVVYVDSSTYFSTTQCEPLTQKFSITTFGCGYLGVADIKLSSANSAFALSNVNPPPPFDLEDGERVTFDVTFDPEKPGSNTIDLIAVTCQGDEHHLPLQGVVQNTITTMVISMDVDAPSPVTTADEITATILSGSTVSPESRLQSISTELRFNDDIFSLKAIDPLINCTVQQTPIDGGIALTFTSPAFELREGEPIAKIRFDANLSNKTSSDIELRGLTLNEGDANYLKCVMTPVASIHKTSAAIQLDCAERVVKEVLDNDLPFSIDRLSQQSVGTEKLMVDVRARIDGIATIQIVNALGQIVVENIREFHTGSNRISVSTVTLSSGMYILRITHRDYEESHRFVVN